MKLSRLLIACALAATGCAMGPRVRVTPPAPSLPPAETGHYEALPNRDPDMIATLRAAPPPAEPEVVESVDAAADRARLRSQGFMQIGASGFPAADPDARDKAIAQGVRVGADRAVLYPPRRDAAAGELRVAYYVRFKLPFGATFRDLRPDERKRLGTDGGVVIGSVIGASPASRANLLDGDVVLEVDHEDVANRASFQSLLKSHAGHPVTLTVVRNGVTLRRMVQLGAITDGDR